MLQYKEKSCNSSTSMSELHHSHTENTPPHPHNHADIAALTQSSLSTNNDAAVPISIKDALFVDERTEKIASRDPRMSSAARVTFLIATKYQSVGCHGVLLSHTMVYIQSQFLQKWALLASSKSELKIIR